MRLLLMVRRHMGAGRYTLTLTSWHGRSLSTSRQQVTIARETR
jgi:hypothetical protein